MECVDEKYVQILQDCTALSVDIRSSNKISVDARAFEDASRTAARKHASSSLPGLVAAVADGYARASRDRTKRTGRGDAGALRSFGSKDRENTR